ncbi:MAG: hypothetical protein ABH844_06850 [Candidatus Omnitrophota bacterium]
MKKAFHLGLPALVLFSCLFFSPRVYSMGLSVDPGEIILRGVPLGKKISAAEFAGEKTKLLIENKSSEDFTYEIDILSTTAANAPLKQGYKDIPDTSWIIPEVKEVYIPAKSTKTVDVYLSIPENEQYENQNFQAIINVKSKKNNPEELFVLAVQLRICISTKMGTD